MDYQDVYESDMFGSLGALEDREGEVYEDHQNQNMTRAREGRTEERRVSQGQKSGGEANTANMSSLSPSRSFINACQPCTAPRHTTKIVAAPNWIKISSQRLHDRFLQNHQTAISCPSSPNAPETSHLGEALRGAKANPTNRRLMCGSRRLSTTTATKASE